MSRKELKKQFLIAGQKSVDWGRHLQTRYNAHEMQDIEEILTHMKNEFNGFHNQKNKQYDKQLDREAEIWFEIAKEYLTIDLKLRGKL